MKAKHRCYKLTGRHLKNVQKHYEDYGWRLLWIAVYFRLHHTTLYYQIRSKGWVRRVKLLNKIPDKVLKIYRRRKRIRYVDKVYHDTKEKYKKLEQGSYEYIRNLAEQQRHKNCQHVRWIKRCSFCGKILASDSINNEHN